MAALLSPRLWIGAALVALLAFGAFFMYRAGKANVRAEFDAYKLSVSETTRILQADNDRKALAQLARQKEAADAAKSREDGLRADAAGARTELDGLRLAVSRRRAPRCDPVPGTAAPAEDQHPSAEAVVFLECAAALTELADKAGGHASDVQTLTESWPR